MAYKVLRILRDEGVIGLLNGFKRFIFWKGLNKKQQLRYNTYKIHAANLIEFNAVADPFQPIRAPVDEVKWSASDPSYEALGQVLGGNWDKKENCTPISEQWIVKGLTERFREGKRWEDTEYVRYIQDNYFSEGESKWGATNTDEFINKRCSYVDKIYEDMKENGYRPEYEGKANKKYDDRSMYRQQLEPLVVIGRNGEIIWRDGYHRYALAEIIGVKEIPVQVVCRHQRWQEIRDRIDNRCLSSEQGNLSGHPDLQDILN